MTGKTAPPPSARERILQTAHDLFYLEGVRATGVDDVKPDDDASGTQRRYIVGTSWELSSRTSVTFDVQSLGPRNGLAGTTSRTFFLHFIANY